MAQIDFIKKSGRAITFNYKIKMDIVTSWSLDMPPVDRQRYHTYKDFRFKIFRISPIFIHSTTNEYHHVGRDNTLLDLHNSS